jgi:hypothetical protein
MPEVDFLFVLHLRKDYSRGYKFRIVPINDTAYKRFLYRREVIRDGSNDTKFVGTVIYPPLPDGSQPLPMIEDVPALNRCAKALIRSGLLYLKDITRFTGPDLLEIKGVGPAAIKALEEVLSSYGQTFCSEEAINTKKVEAA